MSAFGLEWNTVKTLHKQAETRAVASVSKTGKNTSGSECALETSSKTQYTPYRPYFRLKYFPIPNRLINSQKNSTTNDGKLNSKYSEINIKTAPTPFSSE